MVPIRSSDFFTSRRFSNRKSEIILVEPFSAHRLSHIFVQILAQTYLTKYYDLSCRRVSLILIHPVTSFHFNVHDSRLG